jgi:hypothetical protein
MKYCIVPNELRDAINAKLDTAIAACPDAAKDRDDLYNQLLSISTSTAKYRTLTSLKIHQNEHRSEVDSI